MKDSTLSACKTPSLASHSGTRQDGKHSGVEKFPFTERKCALTGSFRPVAYTTC